MTNTMDAKADALPDLDDLLQCPVCYEIPSGQIFQCNEGHHVCGRCKARLDQCPVCRALFFGTRNYAMEELIANVRKLQAFKLGGKMTVTSGSGGSESTASADNSVAGATLNGSVEEDEHSDTSGQTTLRAAPACKGLFRCLCCKNSNSERLPAGRLLNHLRYFHAPELLEGKSEGGEYVQAWQIATVPGRIVIAVRVQDMGVFFLVFEINNDNIYAWVSMAAAPWVAHEFSYTITISGNDREAIFTDCVWSVRSCEGALKKRGRCLVVSGADVRALTAAAAVSGRLALRRASPEQLASHAQPRAVLRVASRGTAPASAVLQPVAPAPALAYLPPVPAPAPPAPAPAPAHAPRHFEPFLLDLQNDVARLSRAFATLGREADALARSDSQMRANIGSARAGVERLANNHGGELGGPAGDAERAPLSRNARRRMRLRLRTALEAAAPAGPPAAAPAPAPPRPTPAPPRPAPAPSRPTPAPPASSSNGVSHESHDAQQRNNKKKRRQRR